MPEYLDRYRVAVRYDITVRRLDMWVNKGLFPFPAIVLPEVQGGEQDRIRWTKDQLKTWEETRQVDDQRYQQRIEQYYCNCKWTCELSSQKIGEREWLSLNQQLLSLLKLMVQKPHIHEALKSQISSILADLTSARSCGY